MNRELTSVLGFKRKSSIISYLACVLRQEDTDFTFQGYTEYLGTELPSKNAQRSWRRATRNISKELPELIEVFSDNLYMIFDKNKIKCFKCLLNNERYDSSDRIYRMYNKKHIITSLKNLFNLLDEEVELVYLAILGESIKLPNNLTIKIARRFPKSFIDGKISDILFDNLRIFYSY